jgi:hypothetical protein
LSTQVSGLLLHSAMSTLLCTKFLCVCSLYTTACAARTGFLYSRPLQLSALCTSEQRNLALGRAVQLPVSVCMCVWVGGISFACVSRWVRGRDLLCGCRLVPT